MKAHLDGTGTELRDDLVVRWSLDPGLVYRRGRIAANDDPLFIIAVGTWASRRKVEAPAPPSPARTKIFTRSRNMPAYGRTPIGGLPLRSVTRHVMPNAIGTIIVQATFAVADAILILSGLGFLGLGVSPPNTDWGSMLSGGLNYIQSGNYWWLIYPPGICIIATCISFNFIGDALRDAFETRLQRR